MKKVILPLLISICFILESVFVELWPADLFFKTSVLVPHFLMVIIIFLTVYGSKKHGIMYGFIFGLFFDVIYTEIIGIYLFMIPLIAYIIAGVMKILQSNIIMICIVALLSVALLELGVYEMNFLIGRTDMPFSDYIDNRLIPTLLLNLIFIFIVAFPLKKYMDNFAEALRND